MKSTSNIEAMRAWYRAAILNGERTNANVIAESSKDFWALYDAAINAMHQNKVKMRGAGNIMDNGFELTGCGSTFKVLPPGHQPKGVTETSRQAYKEIDLGEAAIRMAKAALEVQSLDGYCTDKTVSIQCGQESGWVSARRNNIIDAGGVVIAGVTYELVEGAIVRQKATGRSVQSWKLQQAAAQGSLF